MYSEKDFSLYAKSKGIGSGLLDSYSRYNFRNGIIEPYILEERELNCATMSVFSRLMYDRIIFLGTEVCSEVSNIINAQLLYLNSISDDDVKLYINSPGGSVTDGLSIIDVMDFITPDVQTCCMGYAASMGAVILSSGTKGKRMSLPHGRILIHQPMGGVANGSQASDIEIANREIQKCKTTLYQILSDNTGKNFEEITKAADRDFWLNPQEAKDFGIIDDIISKQK